MVITGSDSYATQISALAEDFSLCCPVSALFYWNTDVPDASVGDLKHGLRIEAATIMREFIDKVELVTSILINFLLVAYWCWHSPDPEGILFYNHLSYIDYAGPVTYIVFYNSETPKAIRIDFQSEKYLRCFASVCLLFIAAFV